MSQFDRITQHREDKLGQAYIRDTDITVSEIVAPIVSDGRTVDSILAEYGELELEDVHQALAFAVFDLNQVANMWGLETANGLNAIWGYANILHQLALENNITVPFGTSDKPFHFSDYTQTIKKMTKHIRRHWESLRMEFDEYQGNPLKFQKHHISDIKQRIETDLIHYSSAKVHFNIPNNLPFIRYDYRLLNAIFILVDFDDQSHILDLQSSLSAEHSPPEHISIQIKRDKKYTWRHKKNIVKQFRLMSRQHMPLAIASRILRQHGSELHIEIADDSVIFSFELPIWTDDTS